MTFKDLKKLVELPLYKEQRVPTVKALEVSGVPVVAEKILENHGSISVYQNGYVIYRAHKRVTVFSLRNCVHYKYDALEGAGHHIEEEEFDESVVFSILVIEHFALKIKGVGIAVYSIHVKFAADHHAPVFIKERF